MELKSTITKIKSLLNGFNRRVGTGKIQELKEDTLIEIMQSEEQEREKIIKMEQNLRRCGTLLSASIYMSIALTPKPDKDFTIKKATEEYP